MTALKKLPDIDDMGVTEIRGESFLQTFTGKMISVQRPDPAMIDLRDIVASLSKQCRFNGHCSRFYSVGEHTVNGVNLVRRHFPDNINLIKSWFIHDFTEAYVGDVIRPVKRHLPEFKTIEEGFHKATNKAFGVENYDHEGVMTIDNWMVMWEKRDLLPSNIVWPGMPDIDFLNLETLPEYSPWNVEAELWRMYEEIPWR